MSKKYTFLLALIIITKLYEHLAVYLSVKSLSIVDDMYMVVKYCFLVFKSELNDVLVY